MLYSMLLLMNDTFAMFEPKHNQVFLLNYKCKVKVNVNV